MKCSACEVGVCSPGICLSRSADVWGVWDRYYATVAAVTFPRLLARFPLPCFAFGGIPHCPAGFRSSPVHLLCAGSLLAEVTNLVTVFHEQRHRDAWALQMSSVHVDFLVRMHQLFVAAARQLQDTVVLPVPLAHETPADVVCGSREYCPFAAAQFSKEVRDNASRSDVDNAGLYTSSDDDADVVVALQVDGSAPGRHLRGPIGSGFSMAAFRQASERLRRSGDPSSSSSSSPVASSRPSPPVRFSFAGLGDAAARLRHVAPPSST